MYDTLAAGINTNPTQISKPLATNANQTGALDDTVTKNPADVIPIKNHKTARKE
jgi:hypothetical protein